METSTIRLTKETKEKLSRVEGTTAEEKILKLLGEQTKAETESEAKFKETIRTAIDQRISAEFEKRFDQRFDIKISELQKF